MRLCERRGVETTAAAPGFRVCVRACKSVRVSECVTRAPESARVPINRRRRGSALARVLPKTRYFTPYIGILALPNISHYSAGYFFRDYGNRWLILCTGMSSAHENKIVYARRASDARASWICARARALTSVSIFTRVTLIRNATAVLFKERHSDHLISRLSWIE